MHLWRCPHCATPQAETARCWVCRRSSTACGACRHFRRSVAAQLGYCALDRQRLPLQGDEIRACWEAADGDDASPAAAPTPMGAGSVWAVATEFIEIEPRAAEGRPGRSTIVADAPRWSLFGEIET